MTFEKLKNRYIFSGTLIVENALHIGLGEERDGKDSPFIKNSIGRHYIPGSSFRGYLRTKIERILNNDFGLKAGNRDLSEIDIDMIFGFTNLDKKNYEDKKKEEIKKILNLEENETSMAGKIHIADMPRIQGENEITRDGIRISRETGTVENHGKFDYNIVGKDTEFEFEMIIENIEDYQLGLIKIGLNEIIKNGDLFGGKISRGIGKCKLELNQARYIENKEELKLYILEGKMKSSNNPNGLLDEKVKTIN